MLSGMNIFWMIFFGTFVVGSVFIYAFAPKVGPGLVARFRAEPLTHAEYQLEAVSDANTPQPEQPLRTLEHEEVSPALEGIFLAKANEQPGWGITSHRISYYKADGSYEGTVEGGILFDCVNTVTSSKGSMIECRFLEEGTGDLFLIGRRDAMFYTGTHKRLLRSKIQALKDYYALNGKIETRKTELLEKRSPHFTAARAAYEAFLKNVQEAKQLEQTRDKLTGVKRMELEDKLRELKLKEVGLKKTLDEANDKFAEWKKTHAADLPKPEDDTNIQEWMREKQRLAAALPGLAY